MQNKENITQRVKGVFITTGQFTPAGETNPITYRKVTMIVEINGVPFELDFKADKYALKILDVASTPSVSPSGNFLDDNN